MADSGKWRELKAIVEKQFPGVRVTSTYRPGSKGSGGQSDYHSSGDAIDLSPRMDIFNWLAANYPNSAEIIYTPAGSRQIKNGKPHLYSAGVAAGHFDHIHWANPAGGAPTGAAPAATGGAGMFGGLTSFLGFITDKSAWVRVGVAIAATLILLIALARLTGGKVDGMRAIKNTTKKVQKAVTT